MSEQIVKLEPTGISASVALPSGASSVNIWTTKLDHNLDKPLINIPIPRSAASMVSTDSDAWVVDLGRVSKIISIQGVLYDDSSYSALQRKKDIERLVERAKSVKLTWGTNNSGSSPPAGDSQNEQTATGNIQKVGFTETPGKIGTAGPVAGDSGEKGFSVQLSFIIGTNK